VLIIILDKLKTLSSLTGLLEVGVLVGKNMPLIQTTIISAFFKLVAKQPPYGIGHVNNFWIFRKYNMHGDIGISTFMQPGSGRRLLYLQRHGNPDNFFPASTYLKRKKSIPTLSNSTLYLYSLSLPLFIKNSIASAQIFSV